MVKTFCDKCKKEITGKERSLYIGYDVEKGPKYEHYSVNFELHPHCFTKMLGDIQSVFKQKLEFNRD